MKCLKCGNETVFKTCEDCQVEGKITISIKEYNQLLDYKIKATVCYDNLMAEKKKLEKQKKHRNCQIADLKARLRNLNAGIARILTKYPNACNELED